MVDRWESPEPRAALGEVRRVEDRVRAKSRWDGWTWVAIGLATPAFLIGTHLDAVGAPGLSFWIALAFCALGAVLAVLDTRRPVVGRPAARVARPATWAYVGTIVPVAVASIVADPVGPPAWFVVLALLPTAPCLVAARRILRP